ncbi:nodulin MtN21 /EamA-like transporter family protein [Euphorbia peplus]|nr:nodulin MtN21 /EamA-like transporter family protein [Euphorbia peplus]
MGSWIWKMMPFAAMIAVECTDVGIATISKAALGNGMSTYVSVVYYNALGSFLLLPFFLFNRRKKKAPITFSLLVTFFLLALIGSTGQIIYLAAVKLSSPTLSAAMGNLIPIFTFLLALITRMESVDLRRGSSQAKCVGAIVAVTGAFIVTLYRGPALFLRLNSSNQNSKWIFGGFLLLIVCLLSAIWIIAQGATVKHYPEKITIVFFFTFFITIQSAIFSLVLETNPNAWIIKSPIEILAIVFTGVFGSVFRIGIHTWCLEERGAVFVAMFKPLGIAIAQFLTFIFLGETLFLGSVMGSVVIAIGFYSVIWGQMQELNLSHSSIQQQAPLLPNSNLS